MEYGLMQLLPEHLRTDPRAYAFRGKMHEWDHAVCIWFIANGYESKAFKTVDGDSFGPLVRGVELRKVGETEWKLYTYG